MFTNDRILFNNLVVNLSNGNVALMNLASFRRTAISKGDLKMLQSAWKKTLLGVPFNTDESLLIDNLYSQKQIITNEVLDEVFRIQGETRERITPPFPVNSITLNLSHICNFNCVYCYQKKYARLPKYSTRMSCESIDKIVNFLHNPIFSSNILQNITLSGGEPLLEENVPTINCVLNTFSTKEIDLFTNGVNILAFKDVIDYSKFHKFQVSLDGLDETIVEINKSNASSDSILRGVEYLLSKGKKVSLVVTWTHSLAQNINSFVNSIKQTGFCSSPDFSIDIHSVKDYYNGGLVDDAYVTMHDMLVMFHNYADIFSQINAFFHISPEIDRLKRVVQRPINERTSPRFQNCNVSKSLPLLFDSCGEVHWCTCLDQNNGVIGNYELGFVDIDKIETLVDRNIFTVERCRQCALKYICASGCVLGNIGGGKPVDLPVCGIFQEPFFWEHLDEFILGY